MMSKIVVPAEDRNLVIAEEARAIVIPPEWRKIRVLDMPLVASKQHTEGDVRYWTIQYDRWLNNAQVKTTGLIDTIVSPPSTCRWNCKQRGEDGKEESGQTGDEGRQCARQGPARRAGSPASRRAAC